MTASVDQDEQNANKVWDYLIDEMNYLIGKTLIVEHMHFSGASYNECDQEFNPGVKCKIIGGGYAYSDDGDKKNFRTLEWDYDGSGRHCLWSNVKLEFLDPVARRFCEIGEISPEFSPFIYTVSAEGVVREAQYAHRISKLHTRHLNALLRKRGIKLLSQLTDEQTTEAT